MKRLMMAAVLAAAAVGCDRAPEAAPERRPAPQPAEKFAYMNDPAMQETLKKDDLKRKELYATRDRVIAQMRALVKKCGGDEAKAKASPEGKALTARLADADTAIREHGEKTLGDWKRRRDELKGAPKK